MEKIALLRWSLNLPDGTTGADIAKATLITGLRVPPGGGRRSASGFVDVRRVDGDWLEDTVIYGTRPPISDVSAGRL